MIMPLYKNLINLSGKIQFFDLGPKLLQKQSVIITDGDSHYITCFFKNAFEQPTIGSAFSGRYPFFTLTDLTESRSLRPAQSCSSLILHEKAQESISSKRYWRDGDTLGPGVISLEQTLPGHFAPVQTVRACCSLWAVLRPNVACVFSDSGQRPVPRQ